MMGMSAGYRALIVDDSFLMRSTIRKILSQDSRIKKIDEAGNGAEALELVKQNDYNIILLDIEMPVMDGVEFMKRSKIHTDAPVIIISSLARMDCVEVQKALHFGAYDVVAKPTGVLSLGLEQEKSGEIIQIVDRALSRSPVVRSLSASRTATRSAFS